MKLLQVVVCFFTLGVSPTVAQDRQAEMATSIRNLSFNRDAYETLPDGTIDYQKNPFHQTRVIEVEGCIVNLRTIHALVAGKYDVSRSTFNLSKADIQYPISQGADGTAMWPPSFDFIGFSFREGYSGKLTTAIPKSMSTFSDFFNQSIDGLAISESPTSQALFMLWRDSKIQFSFSFDAEHKKRFENVDLLVETLRQYQHEYCEFIG